MTLLLACVVVLAACLPVAAYLAITSANASKRAWETLAAANDEAHRAQLAKLFEPPKIELPIVLSGSKEYPFGQAR